MNRTAIVGLLALASWSAQAAQDIPGMSVGLEGTFSSFSGNDVPDPTLDAKFIDDNAVGFKLLGQYRFNEWFGIEGAYHNISDFEDESPNDFPPDSLKLNFSGFSAQGLGFIPLPYEEVQLFVKAGYYDFDDELSVNSGTTSSSSESGLVAGAGVGIAISDHVGIRAEYEWFDADVGDLSSVSLGFAWYFGGEKAVAPLGGEG
ncbi:MAG: porin family protein [Gammaproteobacteria bacterium]